MKNLLLTTLISLTALSVSAQETFIIKGELSGDHEGKKIILDYPNPAGLKEHIIDSTFVKDGIFSFKGTLQKDMTKAKLIMSSIGNEIDQNDWKRFYDIDQQVFLLQNSNFLVTGANIKQANITGGDAQKDYQLLSEQERPILKKMEPISKQMVQNFTSGNEGANKELGTQYRSLASKLKEAQLDFISKNPDSFASLYIINTEFDGTDPLFERLFNSLSERIKNSPSGSEINTRLNASNTVETGKPALDFIQNDTKGTPVGLFSFKGKYILLDFWASWCGPCLVEIPYIKKAYEKFKDKNFEVVAVSLDNKKESWLKAIKDDNTTWVHVSDLKGTKNKVALKYGVLAIPENFLIGPDGVILAKGLRGEELEKLLDKLITNEK